MNQPLLSILIPTVVGRENQFRCLLKRLLMQVELLPGYDPEKSRGQLPENPTDVIIAQFSCGVELVYICDNKEISIGQKRNDLYQKASGLYSFMPDDDDDIADDFIETILKAIEQNPDCITYEEYVNIDGREYKSNHSIKYPGWRGDGNSILEDGFHFWRTPYFKDVIRTDIARSVPVPFIRWNEDEQWSNMLMANLKTEVHINKQLYLYKHISSNPTERYGLDKR